MGFRVEGRCPCLGPDGVLRDPFERVPRCNAPDVLRSGERVCRGHGRERVEGLVGV